MPKTKTNAAARKKIMLMISTQYAHGRGVLAGIADYIDHHTPWQNLLEPELNPKIIAQGNYDGIISEPNSPGMYEALLAVKVPVITVGSLPIEHGPPAVVVDNRAVGRMAGSHLADLGLKNLGFVPRSGTHYSLQREAGLTECATQRKLTVWRCPDETVDDEPALIAWLKKLPFPIGILAANDREALRVSRACRLANLRIPEQVALMGVDNEDESCRLAEPPLTSVDHGTRRIGYEAARMLDQWLTTGNRPEKSLLIQPVGVIPRPSTNLLAISDEDVVAALRFIRAGTSASLKVSDVLKHVAISRRSLEMHFQRLLGRTVHDEIIRVRIERAKHLLITSDWSILQIANACGFAFPSQFSHAFKRETGTQPLAFRHQYRYR